MWLHPLLNPLAIFSVNAFRGASHPEKGSAKGLFGIVEFRLMRDTMRTYITLQLHPDGATFSEVAELLEGLGFKPVKGYYDFVYEWDRRATVKDSLWFADKICNALRGKKVFFRIETIE